MYIYSFNLPINPMKAGAIILPVLQMHNPRYREVNATAIQTDASRIWQFSVVTLSFEVCYYFNKKQEKQINYHSRSRV